MSSAWVPAYIGVGSNLDDPVAQVRTGLRSLGQLAGCKLIARSRLYRSAALMVPEGPKDWPEFVNAAAGLLTQLSSRDLLTALKQLESSMGREQPVVRWGPRRIDFDLLVYGTERRNETDLVIPHPGVPVRNFVLYPLLDIAPELLVPGHGRVRNLAARVGAAGLTPIA